MIDDYPTCKDTYVTLRIYHMDLDPKNISSLLHLKPTDSQVRGDNWPSKIDPNRKFPTGGWFLCSEGKVLSLDSEKHLRWLVEEIRPHSSAILSLHEQGYKIDICCLWESRNGHGGPTLSPEIMEELSKLKIVLWFDFYLLDHIHIGTP
jgi:hypothetical protein